MKSYLMISRLVSWVFGTVVLAVGVLNIVLVHPIPGIAYLLLSFVYFPAASALLRKRFGFPVPLIVKICLGIALIMFTLGVSDLGDMMD